MQSVAVAVKQPFSFARTLDFMQRFAPCRDACLLAPDHLTAAVTIDGRAHPFTLRADPGGHVVLEHEAGVTTAIARHIRSHAEQLIGAHDDLAPLYAKATGDGAFHALVTELDGLHHVRFPTLADSVVYAVLMQRTPMQVAAALKRRFLAAFGLPAGPRLRAMPDLATLAALDEQTVAGALGHRAKAARIVAAVRGVRALDEQFLRAAPYERARDALLAVDGIGPFSAAAILLRGLGRMDALPWMPQFARAARVIYGHDVSESAITRRYGRDIGYWSFYVMTGAARRTAPRARTTPGSPRRTKTPRRMRAIV